MTNDNINSIDTFRKNASMQSKGSSSELIIHNILCLFEKYAKDNESKILDIGCGTGQLLKKIHALGFRNLHGSDLTRFEDLGFMTFTELDCNGAFASKQNLYQLIISSEVIEHLENPRNFLREISKSLDSNGLTILSTPNPESITSIISYILRGYHSAFGPKDYPAHITPLSIYEMTNILNETGFKVLDIHFVQNGRIPSTGQTWQKFFPFLTGKRFSDNYIIVAQKRSL